MGMYGIPLENCSADVLGTSSTTILTESYWRQAWPHLITFVDIIAVVMRTLILCCISVRTRSVTVLRNAAPLEEDDASRSLCAAAAHSVFARDTSVFRRSGTESPYDAL